MARVISVDGPVISTGDLAAQLRLFEEVLGMERVLDIELDNIGARLQVDGLETLVRRCADAGYEIAVPINDLDGRQAVVRGPHGVWHFLREN